MSFPTPSDFMDLLLSNDGLVSSCIHSVVYKSVLDGQDSGLSELLLASYLVYCTFITGRKDDNSIDSFRACWHNFKPKGNRFPFNM